MRQHSAAGGLHRPWLGESAAGQRGGLGFGERQQAGRGVDGRRAEAGGVARRHPNRACRLSSVPSYTPCVAAELLLQARRCRSSAPRSLPACRCRAPPRGKKRPGMRRRMARRKEGRCLRGRPKAEPGEESGGGSRAGSAAHEAYGRSRSPPRPAPSVPQLSDRPRLRLATYNEPAVWKRVRPVRQVQDCRTHGSATTRTSKPKLRPRRRGAHAGAPWDTAALPACRTAPPRLQSVNMPDQMVLVGRPAAACSQLYSASQARISCRHAAPTCRSGRGGVGWGGVGWGGVG